MIRKMVAGDAVAVSNVCMAAFMKSVAPELSQEGVVTFKSIAEPEAFNRRAAQGHVILVAERNQSVVGVVELKAGQHIAMFFVEPCAQRLGIGRALLDAVLGFAKKDEVTVKASLSSVTAYERFGFKRVGTVAVESGLRYQALSLNLREVKAD
ncbi:GNAT family N-acetyltransferase [Neptunomonas sp. XY-337]|uniref:GNAT family N-acetyltransferase n=1 Tax=Neptunomonas sp. XY-337 TaxID=2561897 RepID=UPI0010A995F3|nr:GNAT family N-acetyltransferase [Neptunomonas sp. XY-337]